MQFIHVSEDGKYMVSESTKSFLLTLPGPLTIVSVIGRYRTGKSSLLNGLTGKSVFQTSSTVQAQTKGILIHPLDNGTTILMDTEGLGSMDVSRDHDASIFALAMLASSGCFFNNLGSITSQDIEDLYVATKVAGLLCRHVQFKQHLPVLIWTMRDFALELRDRHGMEMSSNQYLEECLDSSDSEKTNELRRLFPHRQCLPLPRPVLHDSELKDMVNLRPEFVEGIQEIQKTIHQLPVKELAGKPINGEQLCIMMDALCQALNQNIVPDLDSVWNHIQKQTLTQATKHAKEVYREASNMVNGLQEAYQMFLHDVLDPDHITHEEVFDLLHGLVQGDMTHGHEWETKYITTRREFDIFQSTMLDTVEEHETKEREQELVLASSHRKISQLIDENLSLKHQINLLELVPTTIPLPNTDHVEVQTLLDGLQDQIRLTKKELSDTVRSLHGSMETIHTQDRMIGDHSQRMKTERQMTEKHRLKSESQDNVIKDMQSTLNQLTTEVAIWRSRWEDMSHRDSKKRKLSDDTSAELIVVHAEVKFLSNIHEENMKRIQVMQQEQVNLIQQIQSLQVKLAIALTTP
jgi:hypothetical protein